MPVDIDIGTVIVALSAQEVELLIVELSEQAMIARNTKDIPEYNRLSERIQYLRNLLRSVYT